MRYAIHLRESGFDSATRIGAEERFRIKLHQMCGTEREVVETYCRWKLLKDAKRQLTDDETVLIQNWERLIEQCITAGFGNHPLPDGFSGYFEILIT